MYLSIVSFILRFTSSGFILGRFVSSGWFACVLTWPIGVGQALVVRANVAFAILETRLPLATSDAWFYNLKPHTLRCSWTIDAWGLIWSALGTRARLRRRSWEGVILSYHLSWYSWAPSLGRQLRWRPQEREKKMCSKIRSGRR